MNSDDGFGDQANFSEDFQRLRSYNITHASTSIAYAALALVFTYQMLHYLEYPLSLISKLAWQILVYLCPSRIISLLDHSPIEELQDKNGRNDRQSKLQGYAMKSEALKRVLGLDGGIMTKVQQARSFAKITNLLPSKHNGRQTGGPPGLGNWDNSCYQNSIIQGLASLPSLSVFLNDDVSSAEPQSTKAVLTSLISSLNNPSNEGKVLWTPAGLKSMSSWQQQDAQEYFSKVLDDVDKEISESVRDMPSHTGLQDVIALEAGRLKSDLRRKTDRPKLYTRSPTNNNQKVDRIPSELTPLMTRSPLEGLLAQRVGCLQCGYVEGLSLIPFNCLTVPLGKQWIYDVRTCLDDYTTLEPISGVECAKCTILRSKDQLERLLSECRNPGELASSSLVTEALQNSVTERLSAVSRALSEDDFSDGTLLTKCQIPKRNRVSTTKSRQAVVARAPKSLVIHINRSVFDELTGLQRKNLADVHFPKQLDLASWCLGNQSTSASDNIQTEDWTIDPSKSMLSREADDQIPPEGDIIESNAQQIYDLRAVITHYGRHENGHYVCYRKHRSSSKETTKLTAENAESWWRFSDEDVSEVSEENVLAQGGVFMLFYEKTAWNEDHNIGSTEETKASNETPKESSKIEPKLHDSLIDEEPIKETPLSLPTLDETAGATINISSLPVQKDKDQSSLDQNPQPLLKEESQLYREQEAQLNVDSVLEPKSVIEKDNPARLLETNSLPESASPESSSSSLKNPFQKYTDFGSLTLTPPVDREEEIPLTVVPSNLDYNSSDSGSCGDHQSESNAIDPISIEPLRSGLASADFSPSTSIATSTTTSASHTPITDASRSCSPVLDPIDSPNESSKEDVKENQKPTSPLMRTSGPRSSRGVVGHAGKAMGNVSSMVTAN